MILLYLWSSRYSLNEGHALQKKKTSRLLLLIHPNLILNLNPNLNPNPDTNTVILNLS